MEDGAVVLQPFVDEDDVLVDACTNLVVLTVYYGDAAYLTLLFVYFAFLLAEGFEECYGTFVCLLRCHARAVDGGSPHYFAVNERYCSFEIFFGDPWLFLLDSFLCLGFLRLLFVGFLVFGNLLSLLGCSVVFKLCELL